jgi:hypothetical protein
MVSIQAKSFLDHFAPPLVDRVAQLTNGAVGGDGASRSW